MKSFFTEKMNWFDLLLTTYIGFFLISKFFSPQLIKAHNRLYNAYNSYYPPKYQGDHSDL